MRKGALLLLIVFPLSIFGQTLSQFDHLSSADGLLDDIAYSIFQDSKGYIWIGTMAGLQRYDGHQFLNFEYNPRNKTNGLKENVIRHITEASDGTIWVGTQGGGVVRYKDGNLLSPLTAENGLSGNIVDAIQEDLQGRIWIGTENGLDVFKDGRIIDHFENDPNDVNSLSQNKVYSIACDPSGSVWIGTRNGLNEYTSEGNFIRYTHDPDDPNTLNGNYIHDIIVDSYGNIWTAAISAGINKYDPTEKKIYRYNYDPNAEDGLAHRVVLNLAEDNDGGIWVATWGGGLFRLHNEKFTRFQHDPLDDKSISSNNVEECMIDSNGNLWTANYLGGVNRFSQRSIVSFTPTGTDNKAFTSTIRDIYSATDGTIWIASYSGVIAYKDGDYQYYLGSNPSDPRQLSSNRATAITEGSNGEIWLGNYGQGVDIIRNGQIIKFSSSEYDKDIIGSQVHSLAQDINGGIWLGTVNRGLSYYNNGQFSNFPKGTNGLSSNTIYSIFQHTNGSVWLATGDGGLCEYSNGKFQCYSYDEDDKYSVPKNNIRAVAVDHSGNVWVGYYGGLAKMDPTTKKFVPYNQEHGLAGIIVEDIAIDRNGEVWIATHSGASHYLPTSDRFETFTKKDGMTDNRLIGVTASKNSDKVYFCSSSSFFEYDTQRKKVNAVAKPVFSDFKLTIPPNDSLTAYCRTQIANGGRIVLPYNYNSFDVSFASLNGDINSNILYSYRMLPIEENWTSLINTTNVDFKYLNPGDYTFEVSITDFNGVAKTSSLKIEIETPFWQSWWFRGLIIAILVVIAAAVVGWRISIIKKQRSSLKDAVDEKTSDLLKVLDVIKVKSNELTDSSHSLKSKSGTLASSAESQRMNVQHIQSAVDHISENTKKNNENANIAHEISNETVSQFDEIKQAAQRNIAEMKSIENKLKILDEIFKQTNILAINASIEAARAGHLGTGFGVISAEVRKLAETSRQASKEIVKSVKAGSEETQMVGDLIQKFTPKIERAAQLIQEISNTSNHQNQSVDNIDSSLKDFFRGTNQNSEFSQEIFQISNDLEDLVKELNNKVNLS